MKRTKLQKKIKQDGDKKSTAEFKTLVIRMLNELRGRVVELRENFKNINENTETMKKN